MSRRTKHWYLHFQQSLCSGKLLKNSKMQGKIKLFSAICNHVSHAENVLWTINLDEMEVARIL